MVENTSRLSSLCEEEISSSSSNREGRITETSLVSDLQILVYHEQGDEDDSEQPPMPPRLTGK